MDESETNIRRSLLETLSFLASEEQQREFASKVFYKAYQGEWACWWFDAFSWEDPVALNMFTPDQLEVIKSFSKEFDLALEEVGVNRHLTILELQEKPEWKKLVTQAQQTSERFNNVL